MLAAEVAGCDLVDPIIIALPRGGVPVAYEVARALEAPLDIIVVRKLGAPLQPELAVGAIASGGIRVMNDELANRVFGLDAQTLDRIVAREQAELERRERLYRGDRPMPDFKGRDVVLVDDGVATGATMRAAAQALLLQEPANVIVAVPCASKQAVQDLRAVAGRVVCLESPEDFYAVGQFYRDFAQTSDEEVRDLLDKSAQSDA